MSHGNASPDDARRVSHWIDQETQTRIGIRACLSDLRRERDKIAEAFDKIQLERKKSKEKRQDFESLKRSQQQHCDRLHFILDGNLKFQESVEFLVLGVLYAFEDKLVTMVQLFY